MCRIARQDAVTDDGATQATIGLPIPVPDPDLIFRQELEEGRTTVVVIRYQFGY